MSKSASATEPIAGIDAVLVHHHTPHLVPVCCRALREAARTADLELHLVLVDNGSREQDRADLQRCSDRLLSPDRNLGYAGGFDLALRHLEGADGFTRPVLLLNPDVLLKPEALRPLGLRLAAGADAVGPRFLWDRSGRYLLPPADRWGWLDALLRTTAPASPTLQRWARRRWRRHARRHWTAREPLASRALSGALLVFHPRALRELGGFDADYRLYFEETDWLERARRARLRVEYVPAACAHHLYAQSTGSEPRAREWFEESAARFRRRRFGMAGARLLERLGRAATKRAGSTAHERSVAGVPPAPFPASEGSWLEVSPSAHGYPAAGRRLHSGELLDPREPFDSDHRRTIADGTYHLRVVDARGRSHHRWSLTATGGGAGEPGPGSQ